MVLRLNRLLAPLVASAFVIGTVVLAEPASAACGDSTQVKSQTNGYYAQSESVPCTDPSGEAVATSSDDAYYTAYRSKVVCFVRAETGVQADGCPRSAPDACQPGPTLYDQQGLHDGVWESLGQYCRDDATGAISQAQVSPALVARAFRSIPLPHLRAITQPADKTLINFDTIFYVQATPLHRTLNLLGQRVELAITPSTFRWVHGDGTTAVTHTAGAAYPAKDVVYRYQQAHVTVRQHVEIVWTARWSLNGGAYQDVDGTVTTVGPETPLRIAEATPALSGYGH
jgi:hypothetical protein